MNPETLRIILLLSPLVIGGIIAAINSDGTNNATENAESWTRKTQSKTSLSNSKFSRYIANPILWLIVKFCDWTDAFTHRGLKNGTRVAATLYLVAAWCFILYAAFMIAVVLVIAAVILYVVFQALINSSDDVKQGYEKGKRIIGSTRPGTRINQETGVIQKEGMFGYTDTDERIDPETGKVQKKGLFGWNDTGTKVDQETGSIQKEGIFGYNDTESRINPDTGIIEKKGLIGWIETDERINPESGKRQKKGLLGWIDES